MGVELKMEGKSLWNAPVDVTVILMSHLSLFSILDHSPTHVDDVRKDFSVNSINVSI